MKVPMVTEVANVRQVPGEPHRRWFASEDIDLMVWCDSSGAPMAFQLCYDKGGVERALTWWPEIGFSHMRVDDGESDVGLRHKATPLLVPGGSVDMHYIDTLLKRVSISLPHTIAGFVFERLKECSLARQQEEE